MIKCADILIFKNAREIFRILTGRGQLRQAGVGVFCVADDQSVFAAHFFFFPFSRVARSFWNSSGEPSNSNTSRPTLPLNLTVRPCPRVAQACTSPTTAGSTVGKAEITMEPIVTASPDFVPAGAA